MIQPYSGDTPWWLAEMLSQFREIRQEIAIMSDNIAALQATDQALGAEVKTVAAELQGWATAYANAGTDPNAIAAVTADMNAYIAQLQAAPAPPAAPAAPAAPPAPATGTTAPPATGS